MTTTAGPAGPNVRKLTRPILAGGMPMEAPQWMLIFPSGVVETTKYDPFTVDARAARTVIEKFTSLGRDMLIDYDHATFNDEQVFAGKAPAAGWIKELRWDDGRGLLGRVEWTRRAADMIAAGEYRYHSPAFTTDKKNRLSELLAETLTNDPATVGIQPLVASRMLASCDAAGEPVDNEAGGDARKDGDDMSQTKTAGDAGKGNAAAPENGGDLAAKFVEDFAKQLGLGDDVKTGEQFLTAARARMKPGVAPDEYAKLLTRVTALEAECTTLRTQSVDTEFDTICTAGAGRGKITEANKESMKVLFLADRKAFDTLVATLPVLASNRSRFEGDAAGGNGQGAGDSKTAAGGRQHVPDTKAIREKQSARRAGK